MTQSLPSVSSAPIAPLLALFGTAVCILLFDLWRAPKRLAAWVSLTSLSVAAVLSLIGVVTEQTGSVQGTLRLDGTGAAFAVLFCVIGGVAILLELGLEPQARWRDCGSYALVLFATTGALVVSGSVHMVALQVGLAMTTLATAALIGRKAAWPYLMIHGVGLSCLALGTALLYGATGTLSIDALARVLMRMVRGSPPWPLAALGTALTTSGLTITAGVLPFQAWRRIVSRASQPPGGFLALLLTPAAAITSIQALRSAAVPAEVTAILGGLSAALGVLGGLGARRLRDLLASLAVAHAGLLLLAPGYQPTWFILASGGLVQACLWAVISSAPNGSLETVQGLGHQRPWIAGAATMCLLSEAGLPVLAGGIARLYLAQAAEGVWTASAVLIGALLSALTAGRWIAAIWLPAHRDLAWERPSPETTVVSLAAAGGALGLGLFAESIIAWLSQWMGG